MTSASPKTGQPSRDIPRPTWDPPSWRPENVVASLDRLRCDAEDHTEAAITWYFTNKSVKKICSKWLRAFSILTTATAGLTPIVVSTGIFSQGLTGDQAELRDLHAHQFGYLCFGLAALFLAFDRYFGLSAGWMRYTGTAMSLETALEQFRLDWARLTAPLNGQTPSGRALEILIQRIYDFSVTVRTLVEKETQAWIAEFQSNFSQLEKETKEAITAARTQVESLEQEAQERHIPIASGAIELTVENVLETDAGYSVALDGDIKAEKVATKTFALMKIGPGLHEVSAKATLTGAPAHASQVIAVEADKAAKVSLTLSKAKAVTAQP
jgi:hypothetical protein